MEHAQFYKGRIKGDDPEINTVQTPKCFDGHLALLKKIGKTDIVASQTILENDSCPHFLIKRADLGQKNILFKSVTTGSIVMIFEVWKNAYNSCYLYFGTSCEVHC